MKTFKRFQEIEDTVPSLEVLEDEDVLPQELVPFAGVTDNLFSEDEAVVPPEIAVSDTLYTEAQHKKAGRKKLR
jgi:hypothetical protein